MKGTFQMDLEDKHGMQIRRDLLISLVQLSDLISLPKAGYLQKNM